MSHTRMFVYIVLLLFIKEGMFGLQSLGVHGIFLEKYHGHLAIAIQTFLVYRILKYINKLDRGV